MSSGGNRGAAHEESGGPNLLRPDDLVVLDCLASGQSLAATARRMHVSERTVRRRVSNICDRLGVDAPIQAVVWAARRGLI